MEDVIVGSWLPKRAFRLGVIVGLIFGAVNLVFSWLLPLSEDTIGALLMFYGPMFLLWAYASFRGARSAGRLLPGVIAGTVVAFATFVVFDVLNLVRVNLFLDELTRRADWQNMMTRFRASGCENLRTFVTLHYIQDAPLKIGTASVIGAIVASSGDPWGDCGPGSRPPLPDAVAD